MGLKQTPALVLKALAVLGIVTISVVSIADAANRCSANEGKQLVSLLRQASAAEAKCTAALRKQNQWGHKKVCAVCKPMDAYTHKLDKWLRSHPVCARDPVNVKGRKLINQLLPHWQKQCGF